jgi:hypothetical protein
MSNSPYVVIDINQTSWREFGCCVAAPDRNCFSTVTARQRRHFVPAESAFFCGQNGLFAAALSRLKYWEFKNSPKCDQSSRRVCSAKKRKCEPRWNCEAQAGSPR